MKHNSHKITYVNTSDDVKKSNLYLQRIFTHPENFVLVRRFVRKPQIWQERTRDLDLNSLPHIDDSRVSMLTRL